MPMRVRPRSMGGRDLSPPVHNYFGELPDIAIGDSFRDVVRKLSIYMIDIIQLPSTFEQLRTTSAGDGLKALVDHLSDTCTNPAIVNALLALKWHYGSGNDERGLNETRANGCEIVAWRFLTRLSERDAVDYCLYEIPAPEDAEAIRIGADPEHGGSNERSPLLNNKPWSGAANPSRVSLQRAGSTKLKSQILQSLSKLTMSMTFDVDDDELDPTDSFTNLNALEIAAIADAKRFLSQHVVQKIITGIWNGDIIFWDTLSVASEKRPRYYKPSTADPFSRLRVPKYLKSFEVIFFIVFMALYYAVLVERNPYKISTLEVLLYIWFAAFFYDELSEWIDAGSIFYVADVWNLFDLIMCIIGVAFIIMRIIGLSNNDDQLIDIAFDILSLEALFMVPRIFSILSLSPYWGTLIPCLKEMGKDFFKFMVLVIILYLGFLTTFSLVGRKTFDLTAMTMILTKIFFGSNYIGFDIMGQIDPIFGPPLMIIFITLSSILLMGSLTGMLSNSFSRVITHAREEYLYVYSVYVLEASTSNRLTHFYPPFNLIALVIFRPLRLVLPSDTKFRQARIVLLKITHVPIVVIIQAYEFFERRSFGGNDPGKGTAEDSFRGPRQSTGSGVGPPTSGRRRAPPLHKRPSSSYFGDGTGSGSKRVGMGGGATAAAGASNLTGTTTAATTQVPDSPRPASSGEYAQHQQYQQHIRKMGMGGPSAGAGAGGGGGGGRPRSAPSMDEDDDPDMMHPTDVEVRIAELSSKIDRLTDLVLRIQQDNLTK